MNLAKKNISLSRLKGAVKSFKGRGKKIIFTNGCFDILHPGHVSYLQKAKEKNSVLIVGLNSDASVRRIKGKSRPLNSSRERAKVLASLAYVDFVVIFNEDTPLKLIKALKPDVLVKGADWKGKVVVGQEIVEAYGGKVKLVKYLKKYSTTKIIQQILKSCKK